MTDVNVEQHILYYKRYLEKYLEKRPDEVKVQSHYDYFKITSHELFLLQFCDYFGWSPILSSQEYSLSSCVQKLPLILSVLLA